MPQQFRGSAPGTSRMAGMLNHLDHATNSQFLCWPWWPPLAAPSRPLPCCQCCISVCHMSLKGNLWTSWFHFYPGILYEVLAHRHGWSYLSFSAKPLPAPSWWIIVNWTHNINVSEIYQNMRFIVKKYIFENVFCKMSILAPAHHHFACWHTAVSIKWNYLGV